jgi:branched-chain amino acid aminotransferase
VSVKAKDTVAACGSVFTDRMGICEYRDGAWGEASLVATGPLSMHPAAHVLHYGSACFEGLKAYRWDDGSIRLFRADMHVKRMVQSAQKLYLPVPDPDTLMTLIRDVTDAGRDEVPEPPGALYLRPTLIGTQPNIGAAASPSTEAMLYVLASPVGDYFGDGEHATRILLADDLMRTTPEFGMVKSGANYVQALGHVMRAKERYTIDTVLFAPGGHVQETGASNFLLLNDDEIRTPPLDTTYLHGVTRDSVLRLGAHVGYRVVEAPLSVDEVLAWTSGGGEAALSGTAAVLAGVGTIIYQGREHAVCSGGVGPNTRRLRKALTDIQVGTAQDPFDWLTVV